ncbi:transmembrane protein 126A [Corythoichthys intestinalis]|uniref:transmembrane protein 126A n=1 Tax=Corythoichthys intestinalis TaxID=161448 RepID=UPI0025A5EE08|nr:transmembrane protein 126A [Corythoichthys intestinalis]XP_061793582.1 transmembrane protein 126A [Nerophis lumbriciformis]
MLQKVEMDSVADKTRSRAAIVDLLAKNFDKLPDLDQKLFQYGPMYLGGNGALAGLIANSLYRRALNVTQAPFTSSLPMAVLPFMTTYALYNATVSSPLLSGDLNCPTCVLMRGALVGVIGGGLYPIVLALPVNFGLASRYNTAPMPEKGNVLRYWMDLSKPIMRKMRAMIVLQAIFGTFLSSRHYEGYTKLAKITFGTHAEGLKD